MSGKDYSHNKAETPRCRLVRIVVYSQKVKGEWKWYVPGQVWRYRCSLA
jgi:hypothetical protein